MGGRLEDGKTGRVGPYPSLFLPSPQSSLPPSSVLVHNWNFRRMNKRVISEIRSLYRDENDLFRTVTKRIYEDWDAEQAQGWLRKIEFVYEDPEVPVPSDTPAVAVEQRQGWLVPPAWEFVSEVWVSERRSPVREAVYDHESEVGILR